MKKFYESPIVEITVFDVEDVITTSVATINTATDWTADDVAKDIAAYAGMVDANAVGHYKNSTYNW